MNAIEATGLSKLFPPDIQAVDGVDLSIRSGEVFAFLGPNGAGKTTTVRILTTLLRATGGSARVLGFDPATQGPQIRQRIGVALQEAGLDDLSTGRELLEMQGRLFGFAGSDARSRAVELLKFMGLTDAGDRHIKTYSGGMKRRLDLASALVNRPQLLFLDEPTEGLDPASRQVIWDEVGKLAKEGMTVFLTTHYMEEADRLAERIAIIDHGKIVAEGTPAELKSSVGSDVVTVSLPEEHRSSAKQILQTLPGISEIKDDRNSLNIFSKNGSGIVADVLRVLDQASLPIESVTVASVSLDEVFLRATGSRLEGAEAKDEDGEAN